MDVTYALGIVSIWSTAEPCLGIVAACLPTLRPLVKRFIKTLPTTHRGTTGGSNFSNPFGKQGSSIMRSHDRDFGIELNGSGQKGFHELRDDNRLIGAEAIATGPGSRGGFEDVKEGAIEVQTTWESRRSWSR